MRLISLCQMAVFCAAMAHRICIGMLPFFRGGDRFLRSWSAGLFSDLALFLVLFAFLELLKPLAEKRFGFFAKALAVIVALVCLVGYPAHVRYMQHFGVTLHPMHLKLGNTTNAVGEGLAIAFASPLTLASFVGPLVILALWSWRGPRRRTPRSARRWFLNIVVALVTALIFNSAIMSLRHRKLMEKELVYNPVSAFFFKSRAYAEAKNSVFVTTDIRPYVRSEFAAHRRWIDNEQFPFWQEKIAEDAPLSPEHARISAELTEFIAKEEKEKGPWNVLVLLLESFRVDGLEGFEAQGHYKEGLTPNITNALQQSVRFTEAMTTGDTTHLGQAAALCSLFSTPEMSVLPQAPQTNLVCLPDIFAAQHYETYFFCGSNNDFDNQNTFYPFHKTRHVMGIEDFPKESPKGNWGISDRTVFSTAVDRLAAGPRPFFATILSLSNHWPLKLPEDAPDFIDRNQPMRDQLRQYVDWSWQALYEGVKEKLPHTIIIFAADHGVHFPYEDTPRTDIPYDLFRSHYRIPLAFIIPEMPASIAGSSLDNIVSLADMPPTLLKLMGRGNVKQQFMGHDAFSRREPLLINWTWIWRWLRFDAQGKNPRLDAEQIPENVYPYWRALQNYNRLAPAPNSAMRGAP